jgi:hypothetical protein
MDTSLSASMVYFASSRKRARKKIAATASSRTNLSDRSLDFPSPSLNSHRPISTRSVTLTQTTHPITRSFHHYGPHRHIQVPQTRQVRLERPRSKRFGQVDYVSHRVPSLLARQKVSGRPVQDEPQGRRRSASEGQLERIGKGRKWLDGC